MSASSKHTAGQLLVPAVSSGHRTGLDACTQGPCDGAQAGLQLSAEQRAGLQAARRALLDRLARVAAQRQEILGQLGLHLLQLPRVGPSRAVAAWHALETRPKRAFPLFVGAYAAAGTRRVPEAGISRGSVRCGCLLRIRRVAPPRTPPARGARSSWCSRSPRFTLRAPRFAAAAHPGLSLRWQEEWLHCAPVQRLQSNLGLERQAVFSFCFTWLDEVRR